MDLFRKKGDVLDLTDLQRRGLLRKSSELKRQADASPDGYFDLGLRAPERGTEPAVATPQNPFDFLDNPSTVSNPTSTGNSDSFELQGLKNKIDDLEYKLDRLMEKIARLESES